MVSRHKKIAAQRISTAESRTRESREQRDESLQKTIARTRAACEQHITTERVREQKRQWTSRSLTRVSFVRLAFEYAPDINYSAHSKIAIGAMDKVCQYCQALKFHNETPGMYCASGKVEWSPLPTPLEPLLSFLAGDTEDSKLFLRKIRKFHSCFQMTSFGATKICDLASDGPDKVPLGERVGRFKVPTVDEVAVNMVGDPVDNRVIKIRHTPISTDILARIG
ncbi:helitron_like_N domain-containing protein [Nephila pilipes]|uniref:Helitron_like_N domain-containing protein n=1 Tax=Nephila pilipes TaxID=299642 RepID=A0A8X6NX87_NEPPI|nr:helitron_like_N domain-containing protein [Nephila pilipes]